MKRILLTLIIGIIVSLCFTGCRKGEDDPLISLRSRKARITNTWALEKYVKNGQQQDLKGSRLEWDINKDGSFTSVQEGSIFGLATRSTKKGTWSFKDKKQDLQITYEDGTSHRYEITRLASKELWVKRLERSDVEEFEFKER